MQLMEVDGCTAQPTETCTLEEICGFGGFDNKDPDQNFRFILPIFLHAGIVHLILNLLWVPSRHACSSAERSAQINSVQCLSSGVIEREMGSLRFFFLYFAAGIFGFILSQFR